MWLCWLALLLVIAFACSFLAPGVDLQQAALRVFESSVSDLGRGGGEGLANFSSSDEDDAPGVVEAVSAPASPLQSVRSAPTLPLKTYTIR